MKRARAQDSLLRIAASLPTAILLMAVLFVGAPYAQTSSADSANKILKTMSEYLASQKNISATYDAAIEVITPALQKIQFTSSGELLMSRPDKLRARRSGGYADVELVFDGTTATILGRHNNIYAQIKAAGSIDHLVDRLRDKHGITMPGADLLLARVYDELMRNAIEVKHVGQGVIDGKDCNHLAFRGAEVDWQLWVEIGSRPIPRKYVITSKAVTGAPQYTLRIKTWSTGAPVASDAFVFKPPTGAKMVDIKSLPSIDEIPPGVIIGGKK
jgi:hypothetical protein